MKHRSIRAVAELSIYVALAFIFGYLENLFPIPMPVPGMKLGFANVITVIVLYRRNFRDALLVSLLRIILNAFTFGSLFSLLYSLAGSLLSLFIMTLIKRKTSLAPAGGICHNLGQFITAGLLVGFPALIYYAPLLYFAGLISGILIGILCNCVLNLVP